MCNKKEHQARVELAHKMMCHGVSKTETIRRLRNDLSVSDSSARRYANQAIELMEDDAGIERKELAVKLFAQLQKILEGSIESKNYNAALGCVNSLKHLGMINPGK